MASNSIVVPLSEKDWWDHARASGVQDTVVHQLPKLASASNIAEKQFYCLRVYWIDVVRPKSLFRYLNQATFEEAVERLKYDQEWQNYLNLIQAVTLRGSLYGDREKQNELGGFHTVYAMQQRILVQNDFDEPEYEETRPKYWPSSQIMEDLGVEAAMSGLNISEPKSHGSITPVARTKQNDEVKQYSPLNLTHFTELLPGGRTEAAQSEKLVEGAFHVFAQTILERHLDPPTGKTVPEWLPSPQRLECHGWVALTDGYLADGAGKAKAIVEVKPIIRDRSENKIRVQESGQMAAWICHHPSDFNVVAGEPKTKW